MTESDAAAGACASRRSGSAAIIGLLQSNLGGTDAPNTRNKILFENVSFRRAPLRTIRISNIASRARESRPRWRTD